MVLVGEDSVTNRVAIRGNLLITGCGFAMAALDNFNNSASTVQRWRKTAVIGSVR